MTIPNIFNDLFSKNTKIFLSGLSSLARDLHQLERVMKGQRNPKGFPSGEQQTNMIMDCVSQESQS